MKATPPVRMYGAFAASLALLVAQFGLRAVEPHPLRIWLITGSAFAAMAFVLVAYLLLSARVFQVEGQNLLVKYWWASTPATAYALSTITSVAFTTTRLLNKPLVVVAFGSGSSFDIPTRYEGGAELSRFLFGQLGQNVEARGAA